MEIIGKIHRRHKVQGESISAIARDLNLSRNTVKKYLKAEIDPVYRRARQPSPKLGVFQSVCDRPDSGPQPSLGCACRL